MSAADTQAGVMVALKPNSLVRDELAKLGTEDVDNLHITLAYLGNLIEDPSIDPDVIERVTQWWADDLPTSEIEAKLTGFGVFHNGQDVLVALWDVPHLNEYRAELVNRLEQAGVAVPHDHGYTPHTTLTYSDTPIHEVPDVPEMFEDAVVPFTSCVLAVGKQWKEIDFADDGASGSWHYNEDGKLAALTPARQAALEELLADTEPIHVQAGWAVEAATPEGEVGLAMRPSFTKKTAKGFDNTEKRAPDGKWTDSDVGKLLSPNYEPPKGNRPDNPHATEFSKLSPEWQAKVRKQVADNTPDPRQGPLTSEQMVKNIKLIWKHGQKVRPDEMKQAARWYNNAHDYSRNISTDFGVPMRHSIGMMASLSPQLDWDENMTQGRYFAEKLRKDEPLRLPDAVLAEVNEKAAKDGVHLENGTKLSDMDPRTTAYAMYALGKYVDQLKVLTRLKKDGTPRKAMWTNGTKNIAKAVRIYRGEDPDDVLSGHKVRSFFNNIADPDNHYGRDDVTIDTHAASIAGHAMMSATSEKMKKMFDTGGSTRENVHGAYAMVADAFRNATKELIAEGKLPPGTPPSVVQAQTWINWRHLTDDRHLDRQKDIHIIPTYKGVPKKGELDDFMIFEAADDQVGPLLDTWKVPPGEHHDPDHDPEILDELPPNWPYSYDDDEDDDEEEHEKNAHKLDADHVHSDDSAWITEPDGTLYPYDKPWYDKSQWGKSAELHDEPEPALPSTDGEDEDLVPSGDSIRRIILGDDEDDEDTDIVPGDPRLAHIMQGAPKSGSSAADSLDIATAAKQFLAKEGMKTFSPAEQARIINEGEGVVAGNLGDLDLSNTHYEALEAAMAELEAEDDEESWLD